MLLRVTGTILLALGFLMLWGAWAITDPFAGDANIGAGGLIFLGRPAGTIGLVLLVIDAILQFRKRRTSGRSSA
jgi:TRAP-type C4-dicarboxylate transport system permease small subunit